MLACLLAVGLLAMPGCTACEQDNAFEEGLEEVQDEARDAGDEIEDEIDDAF